MYRCAGVRSNVVHQDGISVSYDRTNIGSAVIESPDSAKVDHWAIMNILNSSEVLSIQVDERCSGPIMLIPGAEIDAQGLLVYEERCWFVAMGQVETMATSDIVNQPKFFPLHSVSRKKVVDR